MTENFPNYSFGWKALGTIYRSTNESSKALKAAQRAVQLSPDDAQAQTNLGVILQELGNLEEAETRYRKAIALKPDDPGAYTNLGAVLKDLNKLEERKKFASPLKKSFLE